MPLFWSVFFLVPQFFLISTSGVEMTCKRVVFFKVWSYACVWACTHTAHVTRKVAERSFMEEVCYTTGQLWPAV